MKRLRDAVAGVSDITLHLQSVQDIQIETRPTRTQYQYVLQDLDEQELRYWANKFVQELRKQPRSGRCRDRPAGSRPADVMITVNREAAARFGLNMAAIDEILYDAFGQRQIATIYSPIYLYHVILEVSPEYRNTLDALDSIYVDAAPAPSCRTRSQAATGVTADFSTKGKPVPLAASPSMEKRLAPLVVTHQGQFPAITRVLQFAAGRFARTGAGNAARDPARDRASELDRNQPRSASAAEFAASLESEPILIAAAIIAVYIVLGILYESYIHPITILSTLPSAGVGALLALMLFRQDLNLISLIGIILLIGIVKKNGIMMVDFALAAERQEGLSPEESIYQACLLRFRPIMMTTMAALLGALPLAIGTGTGSELRRPLGIAVVGGLLVSQFLTLYTTPVIYLAVRPTRATLRRALALEAGADRGGSTLPRPASGEVWQGDEARRSRTPKRELLRNLYSAPGRDGVVDARCRARWALSLITTFRSPRCPTSNARQSLSFLCCRAGARTRSASSLTAPLERQLGLISGLKEMSSSSIYGHSNIRLNSASTRTSMRPPERYRPPSTPPVRCCRRPCRARRSISRPTPTGFPIIATRAHLGRVRYSGNLSIRRHRACWESVGDRGRRQGLPQRRRRRPAFEFSSIRARSRTCTCRLLR